jgi:hypothetical protein
MLGENVVKYYNYFQSPPFHINKYSLRLTNTVCLAFKFYPTKSVLLNYSKIHVTKAISNTRNNSIEKGIKPIKWLSRCYAFAVIENLGN